jgi:hypothetical protein
MTANIHGRPPASNTPVRFSARRAIARGFAWCDPSWDGPAVTGWAPNARAALGLGPVAEVEDQAFLLGLEVVIAVDGAMGVEELVSDVGQDSENACPGSAAPFLRELGG